MDSKYFIIILALMVVLMHYLGYLHPVKIYIHNYIYPIRVLELKTDISILGPHKRYINNVLENAVSEDFKDPKIADMCRYVVDGGKRVRGIIMKMVFDRLNSNGLSDSVVDNGIIFMEYIQAASLLFDDIVDGDTYRRGKKCLHVDHGIGIAQLIGLELVSKSFNRLTNIAKELFNSNTDGESSNYINGFFLLTDSIHSNIDMLIKGQYIDITAESKGDIINNISSNDDIINIINLKTGSLFEMCYTVPYYITNAQSSNDEIRRGMSDMKRIGRLFGLIFQIADDFEDYEQDRRAMNKNIATNYVIYNGKSTAKIDYDGYVDDFKTLSEQYNIYTDEISTIVSYLNEKVDRYYEMI